MKKLLVPAVAILLAGGFTAQAIQEGPVAVVVKVEGQVELHREGGMRMVAVGDRLADGDRIVPSEGAHAVVVARGGTRRTIDEEAIITPPEGGAGDRDMFDRTVRVLAQVATTDARAQPNRQGMIRPLPGQPGLIAPRNGLVLLSERPTFTWYSVEGARGYRLQVRLDAGAPRRFEVGADTVWTFPGDQEALLPGRTYRWTVAPVGSGRVAQEGTFRVIGESARGEVMDELAFLADMGMDPEDDGLFLAAVIYSEAGLMYDAARALDRLERAGGPLGASVYLLRGEVLNALGDLDGASAAFDRADQLAAEEASGMAGRSP
jgi:hypothetical protein